MHRSETLVVFPKICIESKLLTVTGRQNEQADALVPLALLTTFSDGTIWSGAAEERSKNKEIPSLDDALPEEAEHTRRATLW